MNTIVDKKEIPEFCRLFKVTCPVEEHFDHYIKVLHDSGIRPDIYELIGEFNEYVERCKEQGYKSSKQYKLDYALATLVDFIKETEAYANLLAYVNAESTVNYTRDYFRRKDARNEVFGEELVSIDFVKANYNSVHYFDSEYEFDGNEDMLACEWDEFLMKREVDVFLAKSKSFRQYVMGNVNPKACAKFQKYAIAFLKNLIIDVFKFSDEDFIFLSEDEIIFKKGMLSEEDFATLHFHWVESVGLPIKISNFKITQDDDIQFIHDLDNGIIKPFKVSANRFYYAVRKYIMKQPFDPRDLRFVNNHKIATWVLDEDNTVQGQEIVGKYSFEGLLNKKFSEIDSETLKKIANLADDYYNYKKRKKIEKDG